MILEYGQGKTTLLELIRLCSIPALTPGQVGSKFIHDLLNTVLRLFINEHCVISEHCVFLCPYFADDDDDKDSEVVVVRYNGDTTHVLDKKQVSLKTIETGLYTVDVKGYWW